MEINDEAKKILHSMSWSDRRHNDPSIYAEALKEEGYDVFPEALSFFSRFGGLEGKKPASRVPNAYESIHFNPIKAASTIYRERVSAYEQRVNERLVVVGESNNRHFVILISESGRMFSAFDDDLFLLGENQSDGLNTLLGSNEVIRIP